MKDLEKLVTEMKKFGVSEDIIEKVTSHSKHLQSLSADAREEAENSHVKSEGLQSKIDELSEKMENSASGGTSEEKLRLKKLENKLSDVLGKLEASEKERVDAKKSASESKLDSLVKDSLLEKGVSKKHLKSLSKLIKVEFSQDADGDFVSSDGKKIEDYVGEYLVGEDHLLDNKLPSGVGTRKAGDTSSKGSFSSPHQDLLEEFGGMFK